MSSYLTRPGSLVAIVAAALVLVPGPAFGQRGASSNPSPPADAVEQSQPAPQALQAGARMTERERLERMREHMISGMRRMAVRMTAVQERILALDRGEPDSAPPVEMGRMGEGMQMRDGTGAACKQMPPAENDEAGNSSGSDR